MRELRSLTSKELAGVKYTEKFDFNNGLLPTEKDVLEMMLYHLSPIRAGRAQLSKDGAADMVADGLIDHWVWCNVYTLSRHAVRKNIIKLYDEFMYLVRTRPALRTEKWKLSKAQPFNEKVTKTLFDILVTDKARKKSLEVFYGVKMSEVEEQFVADQASERKMFCDTMVDRKWLKMAMRRKQREEGIQKMFEREKQEELMKVPVLMTDEKWKEAGVDILGYDSDADKEEDYDDSTEDGISRKRKRKFVVHEKADDPLPPKYRHVRIGERKVRPEYYRVVDKLTSKFHMSMSQAIAAVVEVGNYLFDREWKYQDSESDTIDLDTVPAKPTNRAMGKALEAFTLAKIAEKILSTDQSVTITYHDDGSKKQGAGSYSVQGASINGEYYPFPTVNISSETRVNLAELKLTILSLLAVCGGCTRESLWEKVDFVMTDSVSHNLMVEDIVSEELEVEHTPGHLLCQVHPSLMSVVARPGAGPKKGLL